MTPDEKKQEAFINKKYVLCFATIKICESIFSFNTVSHQSEREGLLRMSRGTDVCSGSLAALGVFSIISGIITFAVYDGLYDVIMKSVQKMCNCKTIFWNRIFLANGSSAWILQLRHVGRDSYPYVHERLLLQLHQRRGGDGQEYQS